MYLVTKHFTFCAAHRLFPYEGKCRFIHGHNYTVEVCLERTALIESMVEDFGGECFTGIKTWLDAHWDHALILSSNDSLIERFKDHRVFSFPAKVTAEEMAKFLSDMIEAEWNVSVHSITVWETEKCCATYVPHQ